MVPAYYALVVTQLLIPPYKKKLNLAFEDTEGKKGVFVLFKLYNFI